MNDTLGKRLSAHRKAEGLTQDQLAEQLGVTAQAVSKWENDQSCPDITTLPKLAEIFSTTTDELLGFQREPVYQAEVVKDRESDSNHLFEVHVSDEKTGKNFEFHCDTGRKGGIGLAVWVMVTAALLLVSEFFYGSGFNLWDCLWPAGLLVFGLFGLYPKFSVFRLGCALFGGYAVVNLFFGVVLGRGVWLPLLLLLFGLSLLSEALKKDKKASFHIHGPKGNTASSFDCTEDTFTCSTVFGGNRHRIPCSRLCGGNAEVAFGELIVDLTGCEEFAPGCTIEGECSFGNLQLMVPKSCRVIHTEEKAFGNLVLKGSPAPDAPNTLKIDCNVSFGNVEIIYT